MATRLERGQELVAGASASYNPFTRGDSLFVLSAVPNTQKKKTLAEVESGVWKLLDELKSVTPADIQSAARTYFTRERLSVAHVLPEEQAHD